MTTNPNAALTNAELTRMVAERQGWQVLAETYKGKSLYRWKSPDGKEARKGFNSADAAWHSVISITAYAGAADAALTLLREMNELDTWGTHYDLAYDRANKTWFIDSHMGGNQTADPKPERACCLAWLAWKDARGTE